MIKLEISKNLVSTSFRIQIHAIVFFYDTFKRICSIFQSLECFQSLNKIISNHD